LALFRDGERYYVLDDACPHQGASLASGTLHGGRVICPLHSWVFDLRTGRCPRDSHDPVATYPTRVRDGVVEVEFPGELGQEAGESHAR
jgi:nitrite reductase/ring-hydroxylating ferredoxin subunit